MPVVEYETMRKMLERAKNEQFAYPAINVASPLHVNAALKGFAEARSDGIIQVSTGAGEFTSGLDIKDAALGAISIARHTRLMAERYSVNIILHTDHCVPSKLDTFVRVLVEETRKSRSKGEPNLFNSHMFDGSELPLRENMNIAVPLAEEMRELELMIEVEAGVVGGEEDGINNEDTPAEKLFTTTGDMVEVYEKLTPVTGGAFMFAATFGNVHGVYKPGNVKLKPEILREGQAAVIAKYGDNAKMNLVFHGGSGSESQKIHETLRYGVIKMNVDTDTQYAYTRPVVDHMFKHYDGVLKIESEVGVKKFYDPREWGKKAEQGMAERVSQSCVDLKSAGTTDSFSL